MSTGHAKLWMATGRFRDRSSSVSYAGRRHAAKGAPTVNAIRLLAVFLMRVAGCASQQPVAQGAPTTPPRTPQCVVQEVLPTTGASRRFVIGPGT
jgi:hypothetical protein